MRITRYVRPSHGGRMPKEIPLEEETPVQDEFRLTTLNGKRTTRVRTTGSARTENGGTESVEALLRPTGTFSTTRKRVVTKTTSPPTKRLPLGTLQSLAAKDGTIGGLPLTIPVMAQRTTTRLRSTFNGLKINKKAKWVGTC